MQDSDTGHEAHVRLRAAVHLSGFDRAPAEAMKGVREGMGEGGRCLLLEHFGGGATQISERDQIGSFRYSIRTGAHRNPVNCGTHKGRRKRRLACCSSISAEVPCTIPIDTIIIRPCHLLCSHYVAFERSGTQHDTHNRIPVMNF